jgi:hypothetical protein
MNRILRNDGTWYKRNGLKGSGVAWVWDINDGLIDPLPLNTNISFNYTIPGNAPADASSEPLAFTTNVVEFSYTIP